MIDLWQNDKNSQPAPAGTRKESPGLHRRWPCRPAAEVEMGRVSHDCEQGPTSAQHCDLTPQSVRWQKIRTEGIVFGGECETTTTHREHDGKRRKPCKQAVRTPVSPPGLKHTAWIQWRFSVWAANLQRPRLKNSPAWDFPGGPVVKTRRHHCWGPGSWSENSDLTSCKGQSIKKKEKKRKSHLQGHQNIDYLGAELEKHRQDLYVISKSYKALLRKIKENLNQWHK